MIKPTKFRVNVRKGSGQIDIARAERDEEEEVLDKVLDRLDMYLDRIHRSGRQPYVIIPVCEGATSLSIWEKWVPRIQQYVDEFEGLLIIMLNIGRKISSREAIPDGEYMKRKDIIMKMLNSEKGPPVIMTTNCYRDRDSVKFDENMFDEKYLYAIYILDRCSIGEVVGDELSNILRKGTIHTITTPINVTDFNNLEEKLDSISFMFAGTMGTGKHAPLLRDVGGINESKVDGIVVVGNDAERLTDFRSSLVSCRDSKECPWSKSIMFSGYAVERREIPIISRILRAMGFVGGWARGTFHTFFTAQLSIGDVEEALEILRPTNTPSNRTTKLK